MDMFSTQCMSLCRRFLLMCSDIFIAACAVFFVIGAIGIAPQSVWAIIVDVPIDDKEEYIDEPYCLYPGDDDEEFYVESSRLSPNMDVTYAIDGMPVVNGGSYTRTISVVTTQKFTWWHRSGVDFYALIYKGVRGEQPQLIAGYNLGDTGVKNVTDTFEYEPGKYFVVVYQSEPQLIVSYARDVTDLGIPAYDDEYHRVMRNFFASGDVRMCFPDYENSSIPPAEYESWGMVSFTIEGSTNTLPALTYAPGVGYDQDPDTTGRGVEPDKGVADKDPLTFSVVYTDTDGDAPAYGRLWVKDAAGTDTFYDMTHGAGADAPTAYTDGNTTNGEAYTYTATFPKGVYSYAFLTADMHNLVQGDEISFPAPLTKDFAQNALSFTAGYSSVAFLPGIGGSRLYTQYGAGDMVWEPNDFADVAEIRLDKTTHESTDASIVVSGITDEILLRLDAWPTTNVYKTFMEFMDTQVVGEGVIKEWKPLVYDWRLGLNTLVSRGDIVGIKDGADVVSYEPDTTGTDTPYLVEQLRGLAERSDTGKVSVVTHSNGGLLIKYILKRLQDTHDPLLDKIDTVIMVAAPQLGTPEAVATLLHGTTPIGKGAERDTAETLPSAYHLLPSKEYFTTVDTPILIFDPETSTIPQLLDFVGKTIAGSGAYTTLRDFMTGHAGMWTEPTDIDALNVLNMDLLTYAENMHDGIDTWAPPINVRMIQIAGWGLDTIRCIAYDNCDVPFCPQTFNTLDRTLLKTILGDGTVVLPSAIAMANNSGVETYYVNLPEYSQGVRRNRKHSSILEVTRLQDFLKDIFVGSTFLEENIYDKQTDLISPPNILHFTMHSPVAMHLYDVNGNHTGIIPNPNTTSDIRVYEENIPNSFYEEWGETKYAGVSGGGRITLELDGEGSGTFTLEIAETQGDETTGYTVFSDIPVTADSSGSINLTSVSDVGTFTLDNNDDGVPDVYAFTDEMKEAIGYDILREAVQAIASNQKTALLAQITVMEKLRTRGNVIAEKALLLAFKNQVATLTNKKLSAKMRISGEERVNIDAVVDVLIGQLSQPIKDKKVKLKERLIQLKEKLLKDIRR